MTGTDGGGRAGTDYRGWRDHEDVGRETGGRKVMAEATAPGRTRPWKVP
ncbi:hypothetical protein ACWDBW_21105 [Streptomyces sp. NPDC001107]